MIKISELLKFFEALEDMDTVESFPIPQRTVKLDQAKKLIYGSRESHLSPSGSIETWSPISFNIVEAISKWFSCEEAEIQVRYFYRQGLSAPEQPEKAVIYFHTRNIDESITLKGSQTISAFLALVADSSKLISTNTERNEIEQVRSRIWTKI